MSIKRGEIYLCALDPVIGKEIAKTRPVVIVSNNTNNKFSGTVTILPITSGNIDKYISLIGELKDNHLRKIEKAMKIHLALN